MYLKAHCDACWCARANVYILYTTHITTSIGDLAHTSHPITVPTTWDPFEPLVSLHTLHCKQTEAVWGIEKSIPLWPFVLVLKPHSPSLIPAHSRLTAASARPQFRLIQASILTACKSILSPLMAYFGLISVTSIVLKWVILWKQPSSSMRP